MAVPFTLSTSAHCDESATPDSLTEMLKCPSPGFDGPNCFDTALLATGVLPSDEVRNVDYEEFEFLLAWAFDRVKGKPERGDLVLYGASGRRDHAAVYVGNGQVFHKKDWHSAYDYRVVGIDDVSSYDAGDDRPRRPEDPPIPTWDRSAVRDRALYRRKASVVPVEIPSDLKSAERVLSHVRTAALKYGPRWEVGVTLGIVTENLLSSIGTRLSGAPALATLAKSLIFQVHQSIIAEHFRSVFADPKKIEPKIYFTDNEYLRTLIRLVGGMEGVTLSSEGLDGVIARLEMDRGTRRLNLLEAVH